MPQPTNQPSIALRYLNMTRIEPDRAEIEQLFSHTVLEVRHHRKTTAIIFTDTSFVIESNWLDNPIAVDNDNAEQSVPLLMNTMTNQPTRKCEFMLDVACIVRSPELHQLAMIYKQTVLGQ